MKLKVTLLVLSLAAILGLCVVFVPESSEVEAGSNWYNETLNTAYSDMLDVARLTNDDLAQKDIDSEIKSTFDSKIKKEEELLAQMLEEYYQLQLNNLTETDRYKELTVQIEGLKTQIFNSYKAEIDEMFK